MQVLYLSDDKFHADIGEDDTGRILGFALFWLITTMATNTQNHIDRQTNRHTYIQSAYTYLSGGESDLVSSSVKSTNKINETMF